MKLPILPALLATAGLAACAPAPYYGGPPPARAPVAVYRPVPPGPPPGWQADRREDWRDHRDAVRDRRDAERDWRDAERDRRDDVRDRRDEMRDRRDAARDRRDDQRDWRDSRWN